LFFNFFILIFSHFSLSLTLSPRTRPLPWFIFQPNSYFPTLTLAHHHRINQKFKRRIDFGEYWHWRAGAWRVKERHWGTIWLDGYRFWVWFSDGYWFGGVIFGCVWFSDLIEQEFSVFWFVIVEEDEQTPERERETEREREGVFTVANFTKNFILKCQLELKKAYTN
jgi:hypothetical protein